MKWVKLVVSSLGALVGLFLIWLGVVILVASEIGADLTLSMVLVVVGGVVFLCALIFLCWARKYVRWGLILSMVTVVAVGTLLVVQEQQRETLNVLQYNGDAWSRMSSSTSVQLTGVWGSSSSDVFAVGTLGTILHYDGNAWNVMISGTMMWVDGSCYGVWGSSSSDVFAVGRAPP